MFAVAQARMATSTPVGGTIDTEATSVSRTSTKVSAQRDDGRRRAAYRDLLLAPPKVRYSQHSTDAPFGEEVSTVVDSEVKE